MNIILLLLSLVAGILSFGCWLYILIDAFKDEIWKGLVGLLCAFYLLYYALFEFDHENKWPIVLMGIFGGGISGGIASLMR